VPFAINYFQASLLLCVANTTLCREHRDRRNRGRTILQRLGLSRLCRMYLALTAASLEILPPRNETCCSFLRGDPMPEKETLERAREDAREGKSPSTQAGEFVREEMEHIREGKHGARSAKQAIAIGLSKARRAGVKLPPPKEGTTSATTQKQAARNYAQGQKSPRRTPSPTRSRAITEALKQEDTKAASHAALSRQAHASARRRGAASLHQAAEKAAQTKGTAGLKRAAQKAARTRREADT
jgi:hypothetical protein